MLFKKLEIRGSILQSESFSTNPMGKCKGPQLLIWLQPQSLYYKLSPSHSRFSSIKDFIAKKIGFSYQILSPY